MSYIRKISVGSDYKNAMHYIVGQSVMGGTCTIHEIIYNRLTSSGGIWVKNEYGEIYEWKFLDGMPVMGENNLDAF
jgi:ABC-type ATPase involved in cell division